MITETEIHTEDGVRMYTVARVEPHMTCEMCFQNVPEVVRVERTEAHIGVTYLRIESLCLCQGCLYRIGSLFDVRNAGKQLFNGTLEDIEG